MHGGSRLGAGRKIKENKKLVKNIYFPQTVIDTINSLEVDGCKNFSQKCLELILQRIAQLSSQYQETHTDSVSINNCNKNKKSVQQLAEHTDIKTNKSIRFIDLFAGIGGIRKGFEDENTACVFSSEWDKHSVITYEANYHEKPFGDITKISEQDIPDHEILLAGFPCQPFSHIGKREGFTHPTQGTLFFDVLRILQAKRPKAFLLENVKGLVTHDNGNTLKVILTSLKEELGYSVFYEVLDAQNYGLPQRRERIIIVGFHPDLEVDNFAFPQGDPNHRISVGQILEHNPQGYSISKHLQDTYLYKKDDGKPQVIDRNSNIVANTLVASYHKIQRLTGTFVKDGETGLRLLSELECKRLMGFPDDFIVPVSRTQMYRQFGNSVAVPMIKAIADVMKDLLRKKLNH